MASDAFDKLDWALVQAILGVGEAGSLSGAARKLGLSQPTLGRQIKAAETALGHTLFHRHAKGLSLNEMGAEIFSAAREMSASAAKIKLIAAGGGSDLSGVVRITASVVVSHFILPPVIARLRREVPEIHLELHPSDSTENLLFHEADIAIRMYRPEQLDVVTQHVGNSQLGLFAAESYAKRRGLPQDPNELVDHELIGYDRSDQIIQAMRARGLPVDRTSFAVRCDDQAAYWHLLRAGCGIGAGSVVAAQAEPGLVRVLPQIPIEPLPFWLTAHPALRSNPRIRRVWDVLAQELRDVSEAA